MSFMKEKKIIDEGDVVILYLGPNNMYSLEVNSKICNKKDERVENVFQTVYGALKVVSLVGKPYGTKVQLSRGWGYVLQPTPELWTATLPHRTQIIYSPDISLIIHLMELSPGSLVVETGTGSGSLSHSLIRAIQPTGYLYTFDFHEQRTLIVEREFLRHGLDKFVTVEHRDVCVEGFGDMLLNKVDAVFLDLPHPWLAIPHAALALKKSGGKICSFSPCIEQVQRTCIKLEDEGFKELHTYECLRRELTVHYRLISVLKLDCLKHERSFKDTTDGIRGDKPDQNKILTVTHAHVLPGHTGFITTATLPPGVKQKKAI